MKPEQCPECDAFSLRECIDGVKCTRCGFTPAPAIPEWQQTPEEKAAAREGVAAARKELNRKRVK